MITGSTAMVEAAYTKFGNDWYCPLNSGIARDRVRSRSLLIINRGQMYAFQFPVKVKMVKVANAGLVKGIMIFA